jgi:hypothetical protein
LLHFPVSDALIASDDDPAVRADRSQPSLVGRSRGKVLAVGLPLPAVAMNRRAAASSRGASVSSQIGQCVSNGSHADQIVLAQCASK